MASGPDDLEKKADPEAVAATLKGPEGTNDATFLEHPYQQAAGAQVVDLMRGQF